MNYSTIVGSTIRTNNVSVNTSQITLTTYGTTATTNSISNTNNAYIRTSDIKAELDASPDNQQVYTFGPSIQERWVVPGNGAANSMAYSNDGINWIGLGSTVFNSGLQTLYNGSIWVAAGYSSYHNLAYSYDGITWIGLGTSLFTTQAIGLAWGNNIWVAVGQGTNTIAYSYDGINWTGLGTTIFPTSGNQIVWNGSIFVATGGNSVNSIAWSNNGITWNGLGTSTFSTNGWGLCWNGIRWAAGGSGTNQVAYSSDGKIWTASSTGNALFSIVYVIGWNGVRFIAGGAAGTTTMATSTDGITWTAVTNPVTGYVRGATWNGIRWVAGGQTGVQLMYSADGLTWTALPTGTLFSINTYEAGFNAARPHKITFPKNLLIAGGTGPTTMTYSSDGINWNGAGQPFGASGNGMAWNGTMWVAVGQCITNTINFSYDGATWNGLGTTIFTTAGYNVGWGNNQWVAVGQGTNTIAYSNDGLTWIPVTGSTTIFSTVGYGLSWSGTRWVAGGQGTNTLAYSTNGTSWTANGSSIFSTACNAICWSGTRFVAVGIGAANTIAWSTDGITWNGLGSSVFSIAGFSVAWNGQRFVAVGQGINSIAYSADGISWTGVGTSNFGVCGTGIAWNNNRWIAIGQGLNKLSYSADGITWSNTTPYVYFPFEGSTGDVMGVSTVTNTGTFTYGTGKVGQYAAFFNNPDPAVAPYYTSCTIGALTNFTVTGWFNLTALSTNTGNNQVVWGLGANNSWLVYVANTTGYASANFPIPTVTEYRSTYTIARNTWYFFTYTYQQYGACSLAINGTTVITIKNASTTANSTTPLTIGIPASGANNSFYGYIDDIRIYTTPSTYDTTPYNSLSTNNYNAPYIYLPFEGSARDAMGVSIITTTGSIAYVAGRVGQYAGNFVNAAGGGGATNCLAGTWGGSPSGFTATGWFNPQSTTGTCSILNVYQGGFNMYITGGVLSLNLPNGSGGGNFLLTQTYAVSTSTWYSFVCTFQPNGLCSFYVNNTLVGTYTNSGGYGTLTAGTIFIGGQGAGQAYNGYIDDLRIYNSVLSITQPSNPIYGSSIAWNGSLASGPLPSVFIQHPTLALGSGAQNSLAYSPDGIQWTGLGTSVFTQGLAACWNGTKWLALGSGTNTMAYSLDGLQWTGLNTVTFGYSGLSAVWNGSQFMAGGTPYYPVTGGLSGTTYTVAFTPSSAVTSYTANLYSQAAYTSAVLVVAGGGGGGGDQAAGGGAGGVLSNASVTFVPGMTYTVSVGAGGKGAVYPATGTNGANSTFGSLVAYGGGYGGGSDSAPSTGANGGSGGGGGGGGAYVGYPGGTGVTGQGYAGGAGSTDGATYRNGGGGGGAGAVGSAGVANGGGGANRSGPGGIGVTTTLITTTQATTYAVGEVVSSSVYFGGGGGAGVAYTIGGAGAGGSGGGGAGAASYGPGNSGKPNTGGGGGGSGGFNSYGGSGGSGCVILSVPTTYYSGIQTGATVITNGSNTVLIWTSGTGSYTALPATTFVTSATSSTSPINFTGLNASLSYYATVQATGSSGNNVLAYSADGITWTGLGTSPFSSGSIVNWNGTQWMAGSSVNGLLTNTLAYSSNGLTWTGLGTTVFNTSCNALAYGLGIWVAGGKGVHSLMYSANGSSWTAAATPSPPASPYILLAFDGLLTDAGSAALAAPSFTGVQVYNNLINITGSHCADFTANTGGNVAPVYYLSYTASLNMNTGYTIMFWMRPSVVTADYSAVFSVMPTSTVTSGYDFMLNTQGVIAPQYTGVGVYFTSSQNVYTYNAWNHVAITFSGVTNTVYINGVQIGTGSLTPTNAATAYLTIGAGQRTTLSYKGYLDDFRVYSSVLTTTQIAAAAQAGSGTTVFNVCNSIAWSGAMFVATGSGSNTLAYSIDGKSWVGLGNTVFSTGGASVAWNGSKFVASGQGITMAYSVNGIKWVSALPNPYYYLPFENSYLDVMGNSNVTLYGSAAYVTGSTAFVTPNQTGLASYIWTQQGVSWMASASTVLAGGYGPQYLFNNTPVGNTNRYVTPLQNYTNIGNTATATTTIVGPGSIGGDWIQLQSSIPLVLNSYMYASGAFGGRHPQSFYIAGSNDGVTWYPIHYCASMSSNPFNALYTTPTSYIVVGSTGTQTLAGNVSVTGSFTGYATATNPYTYFRVIFRTNFSPTPTGDFIDICGWYFNFTPAPKVPLYTNPTTSFVSPNKTSLAANTWTQGGISWTSSASSNYTASGSFPAYAAFNNIYAGTSSPYSWASSQVTGIYSSGVYTGNGSGTYATTTIIGVSAVRGEWLQIQSSIPLTMNSYAFACGARVQLPQTYYIVGSNDGTNWYPIQYVSFNTNAFTSDAIGPTTPIVVNISGTQPVTYHANATATCTTYSTTLTAYTYFRIIGVTLFATASYMELEEWLINFVPTPNVNLLTNNQIVYNPTPSTAINLVNTAGGTSVNYIRGVLQTSNSFTITGWFNPQTVNSTQQTIISLYSVAFELYITNTNYISVYVNNGVGVPTSFTATANTWYNFVATFSSSGTGYFYINGSLVGSYACNASPGTNSGFYGIGAYDNATYNAFNGYVDDFKIYNYAVNPALLFNQGFGVASNSRVGAAIVDSQISLNKTVYPQTTKLDVVSDTYFNNGFSAFSAAVSLHDA